MPPVDCELSVNLPNGFNLETQFMFTMANCKDPQVPTDALAYTYYTFTNEMDREKAMAIFHHYDGDILAEESGEAIFRTVLPGGITDLDNFNYILAVVKDKYGGITYKTADVQVFFKKNNMADNIDLIS